MKTKHTFYDHLYAWMPRDMPIEERTLKLLDAAAIHVATMFDDFNGTRDAGVECGKEYYDTVEKRLDEYRTRLLDMLEMIHQIEQLLPEKSKDPYLARKGKQAMREDTLDEIEELLDTALEDIAEVLDILWEKREKAYEEMDYETDDAYQALYYTLKRARMVVNEAVDHEKQSRNKKKENKQNGW